MISCSGAPFGPVVALAAVALVLLALLELLLDHCLGLAGEDLDLQLDLLVPETPSPTSL